MSKLMLILACILVFARYTNTIQSCIDKIKLFPMAETSERHSLRSSLTAVRYFVYVYTSGYTRTPFVPHQCMYACPSRTSPPVVSSYVCFVNRFCQAPFIHPLNFTKPHIAFPLSLHLLLNLVLSQHFEIYHLN